MNKVRNMEKNLNLVWPRDFCSGFSRKTSPSYTPDALNNTIQRRRASAQCFHEKHPHCTLSGQQGLGKVGVKEHREKP